MTYNKTTRFGFLIVAVLIIAALLTSTAFAAPLTQDERPPVNGGDNGDGGSGGAGGTGDGGNGNNDVNTDTAGCAVVKGQALNWGFGPEPNVGIQLTDGGWQVNTASATDGNYGIGGLGVGVATLHVSLAPGQEAALRPLVQDAGIYLNCGFPTIANLAVFSGDTIDPPATIAVEANGTLAADSRVALRYTIENNLPNQITNVIVTDLLPPGLIALDVQATTAQSAQIIPNSEGGQLVMVYLNTLDSGDQANILVTLTAGADLPVGRRLSNNATLFYAESVAHQTRLEFTVGQAAVVPVDTVEFTAPQAVEVEPEPTTEPEPSPTPTPEPVPTAEPEAVETDEEEFIPPPPKMPTTGEEFVPPGLLPTTGDNFIPPEMLPETGLGLLLPVGGLGLMGLALAAHLLRIRRKF